MAIRAPNLFGNIDWSGYHRANEYTVEAGRAKGEAAANIGKSLSFGLQLVGQRREKAKDQARASAEKADDRAYAEQQREAEYGRRLQFEKDKASLDVAQVLRQEIDATNQALAMRPPGAPAPDEIQAQNIQAILRVGERVGPAMDGAIIPRLQQNADAGEMSQEEVIAAINEWTSRQEQSQAALDFAKKNKTQPWLMPQLVKELAQNTLTVEQLKSRRQAKEVEAKTALQAQHEAAELSNRQASGRGDALLALGDELGVSKAFTRNLVGDFLSNPKMTEEKVRNEFQQERAARAMGENRAAINEDRDAGRKLREDQLTLGRERFNLDIERHALALESKDKTKIDRANAAIEGSFRKMLEEASGYADPQTAISAMLQGVSPEQAGHILDSVKPTDPRVVGALMERRSVGAQSSPGVDSVRSAGVSHRMTPEQVQGLGEEDRTRVAREEWNELPDAESTPERLDEILRHYGVKRPNAPR